MSISFYEFVSLFLPFYLYSFEHQLELCEIHFLIPNVSPIWNKISCLKAFCPNAISGSIPIQWFQIIPSTIYKNKNVAGQRVCLQHVFHQAGQSIERFPHVTWRPVQENFYAVLWVKHQLFLNVSTCPSPMSIVMVRTLGQTDGADDEFSRCPMSMKTASLFWTGTFGFDDSFRNILRHR